MDDTHSSQVVRGFAEQLRKHLDSINSKTGDSDRSFRSVATAIDDCLASLTGLGLWGFKNRLLSSELWNVAGEVLAKGWLLNRARTKPRGYAGDFEMLARIHENWLCDDPVGRLLDRYFQDQAAPQAVRNRMAMISDWIVEAVTQGAEHIAMVGSAFGLEIRDAWQRLEPSVAERLRVTLLDVDPAAIDYAQGLLGGILQPDRLIAVSTNLFRLPVRPREAQTLKNADWIFCPGLFDYLDDDSAVAMLRTLAAQLSPGGRLTVFQFAPHNPTRAYMEWFGNWYLTYRDKTQFRRLVESARFEDVTVELGAEPLGIDLFVTITRK